MSCDDPEGTVTQACALSGTVNGKVFGPTSGSGNDTCNNSQLVGVYNTGTGGTYRDNWGGYNSAGIPWVGLDGCVVDGPSASCTFAVPFTVGHDNTFGLNATGG